ncbi:rho rac cdc42-like gtpases guanine nucleotide exchange factor [Vairimorpha apis BRL 01]|uniref:Rho rac cdc42-like gtpases guanine nucleotide exchange factor n=1 Tax=Vairimorpha apis BRL 01 TaxID=1037528 RepID=T0LCN6_9MICR|nr:rho rac cdc42-like gtpases guanine nucleotide exchange factor [Vairimorpha apis BRL 01]
MPDNRKRLEALDEMYQSERQYLKDMVLWDSEFRKRILNFPFFSLKTKYDICDAIFVNMYEIRDLHQKIFNLMKEKNMKVKVAMEKNVYNNIENGNNSINNVYNRFESGKDVYNNSNIENVYTRENKDDNKNNSNIENVNIKNNTINSDNKDDNNKDNIKDNINNIINNDDEFCIDKTQYNNPEVLKLEYASIFENKKYF